MIQIKRAYEPFDKKDGYRVLIDRLWPRGVKKSDLHLDEWIKEVAPSPKLRRSFGHDPGKWSDFQKKYKVELRSDAAARSKLKSLIKLGARRTVTLVYSARDVEHNNAVVLKRILDRKLKKR